MNHLGFFGAAAIASVLCFSSAPAQAAGEVSGAALDLVVAGTNTGNGGYFVSRAVKDAFDYSDAEFRYYWSYSTLNAARWYTAINDGDYLEEITNIADVGADQILAINSVTSPAYAGHVVVITGAPIDITPPYDYYTPYIDGTRQWALPIADSTGSEHGQNASYPDSRRVDGYFTGNVPGTAYMRLYSDAKTGEILAYSWSVAATSASAVYYQDERPFAIGKIVSPYSP
jgi:hypothetical protein